LFFTYLLGLQLSIVAVAIVECKLQASQIVSTGNPSKPRRWAPRWALDDPEYSQNSFKGTQEKSDRTTSTISWLIFLPSHKWSKVDGGLAVKET